TGLVGRGSATGGYCEALNVNGVGLRAVANVANGTGLVGSGTATGAYITATDPGSTGVFAIGAGLGVSAQSTGGGSAIQAASNGSGIANPTLLLTNSQAIQGMCLVANSSSSWGTAAFENDGAGEVMTLTRAAAGNFLQMVKGGDTKFWVDGNGVT